MTVNRNYDVIAFRYLQCILTVFLQAKAESLLTFFCDIILIRSNHGKHETTTEGKNYSIASLENYSMFFFFNFLMADYKHIFFIRPLLIKGHQKEKKMLNILLNVTDV